MTYIKHELIIRIRGVFLYKFIEVGNLYALKTSATQYKSQVHICAGNDDNKLVMHSCTCIRSVLL